MVVTAGLGVRSGALALRGLGGNPAAAQRGAQSDLLPWDFLTQFSIQKRQWLEAQTMRDIAKKVEAVYESLPEEAKQTFDVPLRRDVERIEGIDTIVMRVDYGALIARANILSAFLDIILDDEDVMLVLLLSEP